MARALALPLSRTFATASGFSRAHPPFRRTLTATATARCPRTRILSSSSSSPRQAGGGLDKDAAKNSSTSQPIRLRALGSRTSKSRRIMSVASEQAAPPARYSKVAAPTTGPIPAAELLRVIETAAKAGADVIMEAVNKPRNIQYKGVADVVTDLVNNPLIFM